MICKKIKLFLGLKRGLNVHVHVKTCTTLAEDISLDPSTLCSSQLPETPDLHPGLLRHCTQTCIHTHRHTHFKKIEFYFWGCTEFSQCSEDITLNYLAEEHNEGEETHTKILK